VAGSEGIINISVRELRKLLHKFGEIFLLAFVKTEVLKEKNFTVTHFAHGILNFFTYAVVYKIHMEIVFAYILGNGFKGIRRISLAFGSA